MSNQFKSVLEVRTEVITVVYDIENLEHKVNVKFVFLYVGFLLEYLIDVV